MELAEIQADGDSIPARLPEGGGCVIGIRDLSITLPRRGDRQFAVENASLEVRRHEVLCVIGESGSGKTVLGNAALGYLAPGLQVAGGGVFFGGDDILAWSRSEKRRLRGDRLAMIFQEPFASLNPCMTAGQQIQEAFIAHRNYSAAERRRRAIELIGDMQLPNPERIHDSYPHQLSGGQGQRVIIAAALALSPDLLVADEPTTALDVTTQAGILRLIRLLARRRNNGVLFITHDFAVVADIADRIAVMQRGRIVECGTAEQVLQDPQHEYTKKLIRAVPRVGRWKPPVPEDRPVVMEIRNLARSYYSGGRRVHAVRGVSLALRAGETVSIVGESGTGKSTLAKLVVRLVRPGAGEVIINGRDFLAMRGRELREARHNVQMIFQDPFGALNPKRTIGDTIMRSAILNGKDPAGARRKAGELLQLVGMRPQAANRMPHQFSGGQRQRICIARALAMEPEVLIADESVSALDVSVQARVLNLLENLQNRFGISILFITHDLRVAARLSHRVAVMHEGRIVESGPVKDIFLSSRHPRVRELLAAAPGQERGLLDDGWAATEALREDSQEDSDDEES